MAAGQPEPGAGFAAVPLAVGGRAIGVVLVDEANHFAADGELLRAFAGQCAAALRNVLLYSLATTDATTGTHIRSFVLQRLRQALKASHRRGEACAVLRLDVDGFRGLNERYGRPAGDHVLNTLGVMLRVQVRDTDIVGRWGADEFLVVLPGTDAEGLRTVGRRLAEQWQWLTIEAGGAHIPVRLSMGGACLPAAADGGRIDAAGFDALAETLGNRAGAALDLVRGTASMGDVAPCAWDDAAAMDRGDATT
jgi:diguanylate cyclase (GGDEF)-like protein